MGRKVKKITKPCFKPENLHDKETTENQTQTETRNMYNSIVTKTKSLALDTSNKSDLQAQRPKLMFNDLPDDVLFMIFQFLKPMQLCQLRAVSRRLLLLASKDIVWMQHAKQYGVVKGDKWLQCSAMEIYRIAPHWQQGLFEQAYISRNKSRQIPWLCKVDDGIWTSRGCSIHYFQPKGHGRFLEDKSRCLQAGMEDLTKFTIKNDTIVSGCWNGNICCWNTSGHHLFTYSRVHTQECHCVDFTNSIITSGSRDSTCKVMRFVKDSTTSSNEPLHTFEAGERVWSIKISPSEQIVSAGLAGCKDDPPLILWDLESGSCIAQLSLNHKRGAGIYDMRYESPNELLTCGYDTFIRLWDIRTLSCVAQWEEPYDSALYCIDTDKQNTMVVGTAHHGMVRLWDKRRSEPIQAMYCMKSRSPVYSLAMDYGHLFVALDTGLCIMDFT